jgi:uncharacterized protein YdhG (YjbR/CyaY superfamily)
MAEQFETVEEYISSFAGDVQVILQEVRATIRNAIPGAGEKISYAMPTITLNGHNVAHFAAWKDHIAVYPIPDGDEAFEAEIAPYRSVRSTARFPLSEPVPYDLIGHMAALLATQRASGAP